MFSFHEMFPLNLLKNERRLFKIQYFGKYLNSKDLIPREFITNTVTDEYSTSKTYAIGDLVMYKDYMYKCNTAITTGEAWESTHWTKVQVSELINSGVALVVTGTLTEPTAYGSFTVDKTVAEVKAAFDAKKPVLLILDATQVNPEKTIYHAFVSRSDPSGGYMCYGSCVWGKDEFNFKLDTTDEVVYDSCSCELVNLGKIDEKTIVYDDDGNLSTAVSGYIVDNPGGTVFDGTFTQTDPDTCKIEHIDYTPFEDGDNPAKISLSGTINYNDGTARTLTLEEKKIYVTTSGGAQEYTGTFDDGFSIYIYGPSGSYANTAMIQYGSGDLTGANLKCDFIEEEIYPILNKFVDIDKKTVILDARGQISTAVGGWAEKQIKDYLVFSADSSQGPTTGNTYIYAMSGDVVNIPSFDSTKKFVITGTAGGTDISGTYEFTETTSGSKIYTYSMTSPESTWTFDLSVAISAATGTATIEFTNPQSGNVALSCRTKPEEVEVVHKMDGKFIPIDGTTIKYNSESNYIYANASATDLSVVADAYSASSKYAVGDVVIYNNKLYRNKTAISTAESFDATKWYEISVDNGMYLHDKTYTTLATHTLAVRGSFMSMATYDVAFAFDNGVNTAYTTSADLIEALRTAGYTGGNILAATGTVNTDTVTGVSIELSGTDYTFCIYTDLTTPQLQVTSMDSVNDTVTGTASITTLHPSAPDVNFADTSLFPTMADISTYVSANPNQIATMKSIYSMVMRFFGRSYSGTTLTMSTTMGDDFDAATRTLKAASDCSFVGTDPKDQTLVIP